VLAWDPLYHFSAPSPVVFRIGSIHLAQDCPWTMILLFTPSRVAKIIRVCYQAWLAEGFLREGRKAITITTPWFKSIWPYTPSHPQSSSPSRVPLPCVRSLPAPPRLCLAFSCLQFRPDPCLRHFPWDNNPGMAGGNHSSSWVLLASRAVHVGFLHPIAFLKYKLCIQKVQFGNTVHRIKALT
jgi:hypothetical protein